MRELLLHHEWRPWSEFFLFMADRYEHVSEEIQPALSEGRIVICERYTDSTLAYQGWGKGLPIEEMERLFSLLALPQPDLTIWLDVPVEKAMERIKSRKVLDRLEEENFLYKVRNGYEELFLTNSERIKRVSSEVSEEEVFLEILKVVGVFMDES